MRDLIDSNDLSVAEIASLLDLTDRIVANPKAFAHHCDGRVLATLFYEPSTRTRLSFEAAMLRLGGQTLGFSSAATSSASKGESVADTIRVINCYADIVAMRHPKEGAPSVAAEYSKIPVINTGDGSHQHPTQTLTDLMTIRSLKGRLDNLVVGLCGDLKYGRTVHSLVQTLSRYTGIKFIFIAPKELKIPHHLIDEVLEPAGIPYMETTSLEDSIGQLDVLYMTRIQQERFLDKAEYDRLNGIYVLDCPKMELAKEDMIVMHPLPRVNEISVDVDDDPRAAWFKQVQFGMYIRMALILTLLEIENPLAKPEKKPIVYLENPPACQNPACITTIEQGLKQKFIRTEGGCKCAYCEHVYED